MGCISQIRRRRALSIEFAQVFEAKYTMIDKQSTPEDQTSLVPPKDKTKNKGKFNV